MPRGTTARPPAARPGDRQRLLQQEIEELVVEAKRVGLRLQDLIQAVSVRWSQLEQAREANEP